MDITLKIMHQPKMTLSVDLISMDVIRFELIDVHDYYIKNGDWLSSGNMIFTENNWIFYVEQKFSINFQTKSVKISDNKDKNECFIVFQTDKERQKKLKNLYHTLLYWSNNIIFKDGVNFSETPYIKFENKKWLIY